MYVIVWVTDICYVTHIFANTCPILVKRPKGKLLWIIESQINSAGNDGVGTQQLTWLPYCQGLHKKNRANATYHNMIKCNSQRENLITKSLNSSAETHNEKLV